MLVRAAVAAMIVSVLLTAPSPSHAASFDDPDWPCVQRKVPNLSLGQLWAGPEIDLESAAWRDDAEVTRLARVISARRTTLEEAEESIKALAIQTGAEKQVRLPLLFGAVFTLIEEERSKLIRGISRYARNQAALAERIGVESQTIQADRDATAADDYDALDALDEREDALEWDIRVFNERRQSLTYVCESPVILEKRAFALGRIVQQLLSED